MNDPDPGSARWMPAFLVVVSIVTMVLLARVMKTYDAPAAAATSVPQAIELRASVVWAISFAAFITAIFWNGIVAGHIVNTSLQAKAWRLIAACMFIAALLAAVVSIRNWNRQGLLAFVTDQTGIPVRQITLAGNVLAAACAVMIVSACVGLGTRPLSLTVQEIRRKIGSARLLLYSTAILLALGSTETYLVLSWPLSLAATSSELRPVFEHLANTIAFAAALGYTGVLLALFAPVAVQHEAWVDEAWESRSEQSAPQSRPEWLAANGLDRSVPTIAAQAITLGAPLLVTVIQAVLE